MKKDERSGGSERHCDGQVAQEEPRQTAPRSPFWSGIWDLGSRVYQLGGGAQLSNLEISLCPSLCVCSYVCVCMCVCLCV